MTVTSGDESWIVLKFGGTSVATRSCWDTIGQLALRSVGPRHRRVLIVASALAGVTNRLIAIAQCRGDQTAHLAQLIQEHSAFAEQLGLESATVLAERFAVLTTLVNGASMQARSFAWQAEVIAQGELLATTLGAAYLQAKGLPIIWLDARQWLDTELLGAQCEQWADRLSASCVYRDHESFRERWREQAGPLFITQGFIAGHPRGGTALLGRGGSDTSAAYFGALLQADRVEIWTDVPGMFSANPRDVPAAHLLQHLHYDEAQEIAATGAKVLHPRAIAPCREVGVPIWIRATNHPDLAGTRIDHRAAYRPGIKAISTRSQITLVSMENSGMWRQIGFMADIFAVFARHELSVDLVSTAATNVTVSLDPNENLITSEVLAQLQDELSQLCSVQITSSCLAITLVGQGMRALLPQLTDIWYAFVSQNILMLTLSNNNLNLTFVIDRADIQSLVAKLHGQLIHGNAMAIHDTDVFGPSWQTLFGAPAPKRPQWWYDLRSVLLAKMDHAHEPCYVYHLPTVRQQAQQLQAVTAVDRFFYAIKANSHPAILQTVIAQGFGLECVSAAELSHVFTVQPTIDPACVLFTPSFAPLGEYQAAFARQVTVTVDNSAILRACPALFANRSLWVRVDLGYGSGHHPKVDTGGRAAKFGLPIKALPAFYEEACTMGIRIIGLHAHLGSGITSAEHWQQRYQQLTQAAATLPDVQIIDIGGGLPIPYSPDDPPFAMAAFRDGLAAIKAANPQWQLAMEPGRFLCAQAGVLLARVSQVVDKEGIRRVGINAGMQTLLRPALYGAWHEIVNLSRPEPQSHQLFDVVGPICESADVFGRNRILPQDTAPGDIVLIADAGAYGYVMANTYNLRPLPTEDIIEISHVPT